MGSTVGPVLDALAEEQRDLARVRVACDWIQYRENFRDIVDVRPLLRPTDRSDSRASIEGARHSGNDGLEVAFDLRRSAQADLKQLTTTRLRRGDDDQVLLEDWRPGSTSCIWDFNALYWSNLTQWEQATGCSYEQALPGGQSDGCNRDSARDLVADLFAIWDTLAASGGLPDQLYVVELGVGNGSQAKVFLDELRARDAWCGRNYYRRLQYLLCDYSPQLLEVAQQALTEHAEHVSTVVVDATRPGRSLAFVRSRAFLVHLSNLYDNLPTDEVAQLAGRAYQVQTRAYLPTDEASALATALATSTEALPRLVGQLLRLGPQLLAEAMPAQFPDAQAAVTFWRRIWSLLRLAERYVPIQGLDSYLLAPSLSGELLRPQLESGTDVRMHVNNGAMASFVDSLPLLHPLGKLVSHDLFVTDTDSYRSRYHGPGKYDGSVVNWVNGPLLANVARRAGFEVDYAPFRHRSGGKIVTMTVQARE